jgi:isopentenyl diphosphate isomerase/L-lactate dehydrogenase-like FMN-dependent dehydrogenase
MSERTRRQFLGAAGSAAVTAVIAPGALATGRPTPVRPGSGPASAPGPPSSYVTYQSEIYLNGMVRKVTPKITTNLVKLEAEAAEVLSRRAREHLLVDAGGGAAARANIRAFRAWRIVPRMFLDRAERDLNATVLGTRMPAPVILAPVGRQRLAHRDGEPASARAAAGLGLTYVHSAHSSVSVDEVAAAAGAGSRWHHIEWPRGDELDLGTLRRARAAGCTHLLLTPPQAGRSWTPLRAIRRAWDGPVLLTGIQSVRDAKLAAGRRVDGIVVSNHRARRGDRPIGTLDALPAIVDAVGDRLAVLFDSGIRTGTDAYKALALGADAVLVGRPYVHGLAIDGQAGVTHVLRTMLAELDFTLANAGQRSQARLGRAALTRA